MFKDLCKQNRSYRGFDESRRVTREELLDMIDCTRYAASSINKQPLKFYIAETPEKTSLIQPLTGWARALPGKKLPYDGHCPTAFIVICQDTDIMEDTTRFMKDVGITAQTILLSAVEKGLGGCMIGNFSPAKISEAISLPENLVPLLIVAIGKPDETIVLTEVENGSTDYYRDENDVHYVPKRSLEDVVL